MVFENRMGTNSWCAKLDPNNIEAEDYPPHDSLSKILEGHGTYYHIFAMPSCHVKAK
jgi:hypothetical protein